MSEPEMGPYPPRVRWDWAVAPTGNSLRAPGAPLLAEGGRGVDQWDWGSENAGMKSICLRTI